MLLATTSSSRASAAWRDSPTRTVFCIGILPFYFRNPCPPEAKLAESERRKLSQAGGTTALCTRRANAQKLIKSNYYMKSLTDSRGKIGPLGGTTRQKIPAWQGRESIC